MKLLLLKLLPTFCYQTWFEVLTMVEQLAPHASEQGVRSGLTELHAEGLVVRRKTSAQGRGQQQVRYEWRKA